MVAERPRHPAALNSLGLARSASGDLAGAVVMLERAATADPKAPPILLNLADAWQKSVDSEREIESLDRALAIGP